MNRRGLRVLIGTVAIVLISSIIITPGIIENASAFSPAPLFCGMTDSGNAVNLSDYRGTPVILHFMHYCECSKEKNDLQLKSLVDFSHTAGYPILTILYYTLSDPTPAEIRTLYGINWTIVVDNDLKIFGLYMRYLSDDKGVEFYNPTLIILDANLSVAGYYQHVTDAGTLKKRILDTERGLLEEDKSGWSSKAMAGGMFLLGILTSISPCSIVLLLSMLSYTMSAGDDGKGEIGKRDGKRIKEGGRSRRDIGKSGWLTGLGVGLAFGAGMASVFFILGLFVAWFGLFVIGYLEYFMIIAGILMILMGVNNFKPLGNILDRLKNRIRMERCEDSKTDDSESFLIKGKKLIGSISRKSVYIGAFALGILFSLGWAPCAFSMILPAIILILTSSIGIWAGGILLGVFGLGHALPVIPLCIVSSETRNRLGTKYAKAGKWMISVFSLIIIFIGILMILRPFGYRFW